MSLGLDIGSKTIKLVEVSFDGGRNIMKSAGVVGFVGTPIENAQDDKSFITLSDAVKKLVHDTKISKREVNVAIPESQSFTRVIKFPLLSDQEIASAVKWEAEQYIPIPVSEAIIQHEIVERREKASPPEVLVLLVAAPRALVEKYVKVASMAGLTAASIETSLVAMARSVAPANQTAILMDMGARATSIAVAKNSQLVFSRTIPTAGAAFSRAVGQALGVPEAQADQYKITYGLSTKQLEGKVAAAINPVFTTITEEVKKAIHYYQTELQGEMPSSIVLSGGSAGLPNLVPSLTKAVGIEVVIGNPFSKVVIDANTAKKLAAYSPLYSIATGLAIRRE